MEKFTELLEAATFARPGVTGPTGYNVGDAVSDMGRFAEKLVRSEGGFTAAAFALGKVAHIPPFVAKAFLRAALKQDGAASQFGSYRFSKSFNMKARIYSRGRKSSGRKSFGRRKSTGRRRYKTRRYQRGRNSRSTYTRNGTRKVFVNLARMFKRARRYEGSLFD